MRKTKNHSKKLFLLPILIAVFGVGFFAAIDTVAADIEIGPIEAESGNVASPMVKVSDASVSSGQYIKSTSLNSGSATYNITLSSEEEGFYKITAMVKGRDSSWDSFFFKINDQSMEQFIWDTSMNDTGYWTLDDVNARHRSENLGHVGDPYEFYLSQGANNITFYGREPETQLDYFYLTKTDAAVPRKWAVHEIYLLSENSYANGYLDSSVSATFTSPSGAVKNIKGFWDGKDPTSKDKFIIRFTPEEEGLYFYSITSSPIDPGLNNKMGSFNVGPALQEDHGFVRIDSENNEHFIFDDGTRYFMFGTTAYGIMTNVREMREDHYNERWKNNIDFFKDHGINKVRFMISPVDYSKFGRPEHKFLDSMPFIYTGIDAQDNRVFDKDQLNLGHWQKMDELIEYMNEKGVVADIIFFGNRADGYGTDAQDEKTVRYIISRYGAYPNVIWCLANEWQVMPKYAFAWWEHVGDITYSEDPWHSSREGKRRPLSIHDSPTSPSAPAYTSPGHFDFLTETWPSHAIIQLSRNNAHSQYELMQELTGNKLTTPKPATIEAMIPDEVGNYPILIDKGRNMPVVNDEYGYVCKNGSAAYSSGGDRDYNRRIIWGLFTAGGYASMGDGHTAGPKIGEGDDTEGVCQTQWGLKNWATGNYYDGPGMAEVYDDVKHLTNFFIAKGIEYWKMNPNNSLTPAYRVYTLADPGNEYVIYDATATSFSVNLTPGKTYKAYRFNPREGAEIFLGEVSGGNQSFTSPSGEDDWVYRIKSNDTFDPADINSDTHVNIKDIQTCIKGIIDRNSIPDTQLQKCQAVAPPTDIVNIKDIQAIIHEIVNS